MSFEFILPFLRPIEPFFAGPQTVLVRAQATPTAYESSHAKHFSHIHFVAHGTASRLSPLTLTCHDFRLLQHRRAFLRWRRTSRLGTGVSRRRGAQAVIAASWGATDAPTQQLMDSFYDRLNQGTTPDVALRKAISPCSIPTDHFARPIAGLPAN
jgi:hypothetical protein